MPDRPLSYISFMRFNIEHTMQFFIGPCKNHPKLVNLLLVSHGQVKAQI